MMRNPATGGDLISVILPVHDGEKHLAETISSVLNQSHDNLELVIVDDGSSDRSYDIACDFGSRDPRIQVHRQPNSGVAAARNAAIRLSTGAFIAPIDADDLWHPDKLAKQHDTFTASSEPLGVVYTASIYIDDASRALSHCNWIDRPDGYIWLELFVHNFTGNASTPLFRAHCLRDVGGYDESLFAAGAQGSEDWDICLRIAERYPFGYVPECLVGYRLTPGTMSCNTNRMKASYDLVVRKLHERGWPLQRRFHRYSESRFAQYLAWQSARSGDVLKVLSWSLLSLLRDPLSILDTKLRYTIRGSLLRRMTGEGWPTLKSHSGDTNAWLDYARMRPAPRLGRNERWKLIQHKRNATIRAIEKATPLPLRPANPYSAF